MGRFMYRYFRNLPSAFTIFTQDTDMTDEVLYNGTRNNVVLTKHLGVQIQSYKTHNMICQTFKFN